MEMEQIEAIQFDGMIHSRLHEKGDEHNHRSGGYTEVVLAFSEEKALGLLPMTTDGRFNFDRWFNFVELDEHGNVVVDDGIRINASDELYKLEEPKVKRVDDWHRYDLMRKIQQKAAKELSTRIGIDDLLDHIREMKALEELVPAALEAAQRRQDEVRPRYEAYLAKKKAEGEADERAKEEQRAEFNRKKAEAEAKVAAWIEKNGSERLKLGMAEGHRCRKLLISEIVGKEYPGFVLDYDREVTEKDRSCPSLMALKCLDELRKRPWADDVVIVWLPNGLTELDEGCYYGEDQACEAIHVRLDVGDGDKYFAYHLTE